MQIETEKKHLLPPVILGFKSLAFKPQKLVYVAGKRERMVRHTERKGGEMQNNAERK